MSTILSYKPGDMIKVISSSHHSGYEIKTTNLEPYKEHQDINLIGLIIEKTSYHPLISPHIILGPGEKANLEKYYKVLVNDQLILVNPIAILPI